MKQLKIVLVTGKTDRSVENRTRNRTKNVLKPGVVIFASCSAAPSASEYLIVSTAHERKLVKMIMHVHLLCYRCCLIKMTAWLALVTE